MIHYDYMSLMHPPPTLVYEGIITQAGMHRKRSIVGAQTPLFRPLGLDLDITYKRGDLVVHDELTVPDIDARELLDDFGAQYPRDLIGRIVEVHVSVNYAAGIAKKMATAF